MAYPKQIGRLACVSALAGYFAFVAAPIGIAWAQHEDHQHAQPAHATDPVPGKTHNEHADHGGDSHAEKHHVPGQINWFYGLISEKEGISEPDLLFRPKGMPAPFLATLINFGAVLYILISKAGPMINKGLLDRRDEFQKGIEVATKAQAEAQARFDEQQGRLDHIDEEIARIRTSFAEQGKHERERIERESKERHERFIREAHQLIQQEGRALQQRLLAETVDAVTSSAQETLRSQLTSNDQERLASEYLNQLGSLSIKRGEA